jgi:hypothetical protein
MDTKIQVLVPFEGTRRHYATMVGLVGTLILPKFGEMGTPM